MKTVFLAISLTLASIGLSKTNETSDEFTTKVFVAHESVSPLTEAEWKQISKDLPRFTAYDLKKATKIDHLTVEVELRSESLGAEATLYFHRNGGSWGLWSSPILTVSERAETAFLGDDVEVAIIEVMNWVHFAESERVLEGSDWDPTLALGRAYLQLFDLYRHQGNKERSLEYLDRSLSYLSNDQLKVEELTDEEKVKKGSHFVQKMFRELSTPEWIKKESNQSVHTTPASAPR